MIGLHGHSWTCKNFSRWGMWLFARWEVGIVISSTFLVFFFSCFHNIFAFAHNIMFCDLLYFYLYPCDFFIYNFLWALFAQSSLVLGPVVWLNQWTAAWLCFCRRFFSWVNICNFSFANLLGIIAQVSVACNISKLCTHPILWACQRNDAVRILLNPWTKQSKEIRPK